MNTALQPFQRHILSQQVAQRSHLNNRRRLETCTAVKAFHIDHRRHLDLALKRQEDRQAYMAQSEQNLNEGRVVEVQNLEHLEKCLELAGGKVAVLALYSRSCGVCKAVSRDLIDELAREAHYEKAGIVFLRHDVNSEFDFPTDLAQFYGVKTVPKFLFAVDGAVVDSVSMIDVRRVARSEDDAVGSGRAHLKRTLRKLLIKNAPSARR